MKQPALKHLPDSTMGQLSHYHCAHALDSNGIVAGPVQFVDGKLEWRRQYFCADVARCVIYIRIHLINSACLCLRHVILGTGMSGGGGG